MDIIQPRGRYNILIIIFSIVECSLKITKTIRDKSITANNPTIRTLPLPINKQINTIFNPSSQKITKPSPQTLSKRQIRLNNAPNTCTSTSTIGTQIKSNGTLVLCFLIITSTLKNSKKLLSNWQRPSTKNGLNSKGWLMFST